MQRKMKLIRKLHDWAEMSTMEERLPVPDFNDYSEAEVHCHLGLCEEAGYLVLYQPEANDPTRRFGRISRLTWAGHEDLRAIRAEHGVN